VRGAFQPLPLRNLELFAPPREARGSRRDDSRGFIQRSGIHYQPNLTETLSSGPGISLVIPAWNEEDRLRSTLERFLPSLEARNEPFEVIVVSDGDLDRTAEVAESFSGRGVRVLRFDRKLGKGGAIRAGLHEARFDYVGYLDADGPISPDEVYQLVGKLDQCDCVIASRWSRGSVVLEDEPLFNRFAGRIWNMLVRSMLFLPLKDTQCGAKFFRRSVVLPVLRTVAVTNRAFDVDLLYHVRKAGGNLQEFPVTWRHDKASRMPIGKAIPIMFVSLVGVRMMNLPILRAVPEPWVNWFLTRYAAV
jgi:dolichol-phosphate mannosyltransferase